MTEIRIPKEHVRSFLEIRALEEAQELELLAALENEPPTLSRVDLQTRATSRIDDIGHEDLSRIMKTLTTLYALRDNMGLQIPEFVEAVCDAMEVSGAEELEFADAGERDVFKERLTRLLGVDSLEVAARANDLLKEHEHTIHGPARVLSDIRPIFGPDPEDQPRGAIVIHTLKISYHEGSRVKELFIALNSKEVDQLIGVLGRASLKGESLKRTLEAADVPHIDTD